MGPLVVGLCLGSGLMVQPAYLGAAVPKMVTDWTPEGDSDKSEETRRVFMVKNWRPGGPGVSGSRGLGLGSVIFKEEA